MARWIYNRPWDCCNEAELEVAKQLARLPEDWIVRWGFYYRGDREGDFLIIGPIGGALVLEVKGGPIRKLGTTGRWDGPEKDHPVAQLCAEWSAVVDRLKAVSQNRLPPFVAKALCLPQFALSPGSNAYKGIDRQLILDQNDLEDFETAWRRLFVGHLTKVLKESREVFSEAYGYEVTPKAIRHFITETDRILLRHATAEFELLDMLHENRQLLVQGGPGTGKTWLAFEQAYRLAERDAGRHVLLLCYNLALARTLEAMVAGRKPRCGQITVRSWQMLAEELYQSSRLKWREPDGYEDERRFFAEEVPSRMREIVGGRKFCPRYDALVVDEAQDHDTSFSGERAGGDGAGWWSTYFKLLKHGAESPIAAFYDPGQRPLFRDSEAFEVARLRQHLSQAAHVKLAHALRYTRPVFQFLKSLQSGATAPLVAELPPGVVGMRTTRITCAFTSPASVTSWALLFRNSSAPSRRSVIA